MFIWFDASWFGVYIFGAFYIWGLWWFGGFCFEVFWWFFDFMLLWCFFDFLGGLIFWFFDAFLMFFWFFYDFFFWLLLWFYSPKRVQLLKFSCNLFFLGYTVRRWWGDTQNVTAQSFAALGLVFNRICESIKKYKTVTLWFSRRQRLQVASLVFSGSTLYLTVNLCHLAVNLMSLVTCKTWTFWVRFYTFTN